MKNIFLLFILVFTLHASTPRSTNFAPENAGIYTLYSIIASSKYETTTTTFTNNQACTEYYGETQCVEIENPIYELVVDAQGNLSVSDYNTQYMTQGLEYCTSVYDENINQNLNIIFSTNSFSYCYNEKDTENCFVFTKMSSSSSSANKDEVTQEELVAQTKKQKQYTDELKTFEYASGAQKSKFIEILGDIKADKLVENAYLAENRLGLLIDYKAGYSGIVVVTPDDDKGGKSSKKLTSIDITYSNEIKKITRQLVTKNRVKTAKLLRSGKSSVGNNKVLALMAQYWDWNTNDDVPLIANLLESEGYDVTHIRYDIEGEGKLQDFKNWDSYGIVLISTHGLSGNYKDRTGYGKSSYVTLLQTNIFVTPEDNTAFHEELLAGRLYLGSKKYYITQKFVTHYNETFPNSFIYVSACKGAKHDYMANAFLEKDAGAYVSWSDNVKVSFAQENGLLLFSNLLKDEQTSINDVYKIPDSFNGYEGYKTGIKESDPDKEPAELIVFTRNNVKLKIDTQEDLSISTLEDLLNLKTYQIDGAFSHYDFEGSEDAFDWVYKDRFGYAQLKGKKATENNVFGWKDVSLENEPIADWYMFSLGEDIDGDGSSRFDWMIVSANEQSQQVYKLSGVTNQGNFKYLGPLEIRYSLSIDKKNITFNK